MSSRVRLAGLALAIRTVAWAQARRSLKEIGQSTLATTAICTSELMCAGLALVAFDLARQKIFEGGRCTRVARSDGIQV